MAAHAAPLALERRTAGADGSKKLLLRTEDGRPVEAVLMRFARGGGGAAAGRALPPRYTACLSSQSGCALSCTFCATGRMGLGRSLTAGEIVAQLDALARAQVEDLGDEAVPGVDNVVMMGMGEPFHNYDAVLEALRELADQRGRAIAPRRMTISTVGWVPGIERLAHEPFAARLALSLHAPTDAIRETLMPVSRRFPLEHLMRACADYCATSGRSIFVEYLLLEGVNDAPEHARALAELLLGALDAERFHVNLIAYNPAGTHHVASPPRVVREFRDALREAGTAVSYRVSRGRGIGGACGQLAGA